MQFHVFVDAMRFASMVFKSCIVVASFAFHLLTDKVLITLAHFLGQGSVWK